jgi:bacteriorhodopsin
MIRPAMFAEMGLNLPVMYIQAMILAGASFQQYFSFISLLLVVVLNVLHAVSLYVFSIVELPFAWVWFGFGAVFWLGIATTMTLPVLRSASKQNNRVYSMFVISLVGLLMAQVLYPTLLAFFKTARLDMFKYLIGLGLLDFMTRIGLGVYYCLNGDAFGEVQIYVTKSLKAD